jgi:probable HAF family extracellular repeat protein
MSAHANPRVVASVLSGALLIASVGALIDAPARAGAVRAADGWEVQAARNHSSATDINDRGWIVGSSTSPDGSLTQHPVLWRPKSHRIVDLGAFKGYDWGTASAINHRGDIVGSYFAAPDLDDAVAFLRRHGTRRKVDLGTLGGDSAFATDINVHRHVVGRSTTSTGEVRPFLWRPRTHRMKNLGTLGNRTYSEAIAINDDGTVLGRAWTPRAHGTDWHTWLWKPHHDHLIRLTRRGLPPATDVQGINSRGQVVGCTYKDGDPNRAILWRPLSQDTISIRSLGGRACAWGINDKSEVVGWSGTSTGATRAFRWTPGMRRMHSIGSLRHGPSVATDVNSHGFIVGSSGGGLRYHAFVWDPRVRRMTNLGTLVN